MTKKKQGGKSININYATKSTNTGAVTRFVERQLPSGQGYQITIGANPTARHPRSKVAIQEVIRQTELGSKYRAKRPFMSYAGTRGYAKLNQIYNRMREGGFGEQAIVKELGQTQVQYVQDVITRWKKPELKKRTIRRKGHDKPLEETETMKDSIEYRVTKVDNKTTRINRIKDSIQEILHLPKDAFFGK